MATASPKSAQARTDAKTGFVRRQVGRRDQSTGKGIGLLKIDSFAGLPLSRWLFALRIWLAVHVALGVAFWIQLKGADSAGITVGILAMQTRGQILEKSIFRLLGTAVGGVMAIVIVGLFAQTRDLYIFAYSAWLGLCVFAAGFLDGNRAYAAVLSGYTVSIVAVLQIDDPNNVFSEVINRCAAVAIGIASITLVVDLLSGPEIGPGLVARIGEGSRRVRAFTEDLLRTAPSVDLDMRVAAMMRATSDQHAPLGALSVEAVSGTARAGAARATLAALVDEVRTARELALAERARRHSGDPDLRELVVRRLREECRVKRGAAAEAFAAAREGRRIPRPPGMPLYRSRESALRNGLRAAVASMLAGFLFVLLGWPQASLGWALIGILMCLSSIAPAPGAVTKGALIALPAAVVAGGVTEFLILGGVDAFPLLMLGMAPALISGGLLTSSPDPAKASIGLLLTVFTVAIIDPSNPQNYDPQSYLIESLLSVFAAVLAFVLVRILFPTSDERRCAWALAAARRDMHAALNGAPNGRSEEETCLLDASRVATLSGLRGVAPADVSVMLRMADLARTARRVSRGLDHLNSSPMDGPSTRPDWIGRVRKALSTANASELRREARALAEPGARDSWPLAADMAWAAELIDAPMAHPVPETA